MKQTFLLLALAAMIFSVSCTSAPKSDEAVVSDAKEVADASTAATAYGVNTDRSQVAWVGTKVTGRHTGIINVSGGTLSVAGGNIVGGDFTIDMNTLAATDMDEEGNANLTGHLKSGDFFDVENHPTAKFEITGVKAIEAAEANTGDDFEELNAYKLANPTHLVAGNLTMHGVTKNIEFPAEVAVGATGVKAKAKFNISRSDWGVNYTGKKDDLISNTVNLGIQLISE